MLATFLIAGLLLSSCGGGQNFQKTGFYLSNIFDVTIYSGKDLSNSNSERILTQSLESLRELDNRINPLNPIGDINALNDNSSKHPVKISPVVFSLVEKAMKGAELTDGTYDPTNASLLQLFQNDQQGSAAQIKNALSKIDYQRVLLDSTYQTVRFAEPSVELTFDGLKKGYAIDLIAENLVNSNISSALIRSNNTLFVLGKKKAYQVTVPHPDDPDKKAAKFSIKNKGYAQVGGQDENFYKNAESWLPAYRQKLEIDDKSFPLYVGVVAPNAVTAEVLAHALFIMGPAKGVALIQKLKYDVIYLTRDENGNLHAYATNGLKSKIKGIALN